MVSRRNELPIHFSPETGREEEVGAAEPRPPVFGVSLAASLMLGVTVGEAEIGGDAESSRLCAETTEEVPNKLKGNSVANVLVAVVARKLYNIALGS